MGFPARGFVHRQDGTAAGENKTSFKTKGGMRQTVWNAMEGCNLRDPEVAAGYRLRDVEWISGQKHKG
jgi:hypothetical protein